MENKPTYKYDDLSPEELDKFIVKMSFEEVVSNIIYLRHEFAEAYNQAIDLIKKYESKNFADDSEQAENLEYLKLNIHKFDKVLDNTSCFGELKTIPAENAEDAPSNSHVDENLKTRLEDILNQLKEIREQEYVDDDKIKEFENQVDDCIKQIREIRKLLTSFIATGFLKRFGFRSNFINENYSVTKNNLEEFLIFDLGLPLGDVPDTIDQRILDEREKTKRKQELLATKGSSKDNSNNSEEIIGSYIAKTGITDLYVQDSVWDDQRSIIDLVQNHLPSDSGGTIAEIEFCIDNDLWLPFSENKYFNFDEIKAIRIKDDGKGFDISNLIYLGSDKSGSSIGKFGEGLKIAVASLLSKNEDRHLSIELGSKNWRAIPYFDDEIALGSKEARPLCYKIETLKEPIQGSYTVLKNPTPRICEIFETIGDDVLYFSDSVPIYSSDNLDILNENTDNDSNIYVRGMLIPSSYIVSLFSYNFKNLDIQNRDRHSISERAIKLHLEDLLPQVNDVSIIERLIRSCNEYVNEGYRPVETEIKYSNEELTPEQQLRWIKTFQNIYGKNATIAHHTDDDEMNVYKAQHLGLSVKFFPEGMWAFIRSLRGPDGERITSYEEELKKAIDNAKTIPQDELTDDEKDVIKFLLDKAATSLPDAKIKNIEVYDYDEEYFDTKAAGFASKGETVYISRQTFKNIHRLFDVFFHESAHAYTGAEDPDVKFRDFLTSVMADWFSEKNLPGAGKFVESLDPNERLWGFDTSVSELKDFAYFLRNNGLVRSERDKIERLIEQAESMGIDLPSLRRALDKKIEREKYRKQW